MDEKPAFIPQREFDCISCKRHIILICGYEDTKECGACQTLPGWYNDPVLRKAFHMDDEGSNDVTYYPPPPS